MKLALVVLVFGVVFVVGGALAKSHLATSSSLGLSAEVLSTEADGHGGLLVNVVLRQQNQHLEWLALSVERAQLSDGTPLDVLNAECAQIRPPAEFTLRLGTPDQAVVASAKSVSLVLHATSEPTWYCPEAVRARFDETIALP